MDFNPYIDRLRIFHTYVLSYWLRHHASQTVPVSHNSAIVFSPHQDDETLGCGGTIALKRQLGIPVKVVFLSDGRLAPPQKGMQLSQDEVVEVRQHEARAALQILGIDSPDIHFLQYPDGGLRKLSEAQRRSLIEQVVQLLQTFQPQEIYLPHRHDCHPDHEATYELVKAAITQAQIQLEVLQYPIWLFWQRPLLWRLKPQDIAHAQRLDITSVKTKKQQAIAAYPSQCEILPRGFLNQFLATDEIFFLQSRLG